MADDDLDAQFFAIANEVAASEANDYLEQRLKAVDNWVAQRQAAGMTASLRDLIDKVMNEPNTRGPVIVALCTALWRLRAIEKGTYGDAK